jgi:hypothetical protein
LEAWEAAKSTRPELVDALKKYEQELVAFDKREIHLTDVTNYFSKAVWGRLDKVIWPRQETTELRLFSGTLDTWRFYAQIEFMASVIHFAKNHAEGNLTAEKYLWWVQRYKHPEYQNLKKLLRKLHHIGTQRNRKVKDGQSNTTKRARRTSEIPVIIRA